MPSRQVRLPLDALGLRCRRLGALPLVHHLMGTLGLDALLERFVPTEDRRVRVPHGRALGAMVRLLAMTREPIYRQGEVMASYPASLLGLEERDVPSLGDDRLGRALDQLFEADRASLFTQTALALGERFGVSFDRFHNDSTTVKFFGAHVGGRGHPVRGRPTRHITYGHSKDHRPDLKQLLYILTTTADGDLPIQFRCEDGSTSDVRTHIETWDGLARLAGRPDFLYVADSKLCSEEQMQHIDRRGGRFITVLPRTRTEDARFRRWIGDHEPAWEVVRNRENPRGSTKPRDVWRVWRSEQPSREGWPITWTHSSLLAGKQAAGREERIARTLQELADLRTRLLSPRSRLRKRRSINEALRELFGRLRTGRYVRVQVAREASETFRQKGPGRPGPNTEYRKVTKQRLTLTWHLADAVIAAECRHDGMFPLLSNDRALTPGQILLQYKQQPRLERRFRQLKDPMAIAPVFLKDAARIEAFFALYALALLVQALLERQLREAMRREEITFLPIYPEGRPSRFPTAAQVLRAFERVDGHVLINADRELKAFPPTLDPVQKEIVRLLGVPLSAYQ